MSESTATLLHLYQPATRWRRPMNPLATGLLAGVLLGSAVTALAIEPVRDALAEEPVSVEVRDWPKRPLESEWRGYQTPVNVNAMFRDRR